MGLPAEAIQPLLKALPINEKRKVFEWLKIELQDVPISEPVNRKLREKLIKHITKKRQ